ncbi:MAG: hypothetical protein RLZZ135_2298 [Cyanobacteriota bacterium]|jgi:hypothetical protein
MNWKILLVIAGLSLSAGLTACNKEAGAPDATKTESTTPGATDPTKAGDKPGAMGGDKPGAKPGDKPGAPAAPKKP